LGNDGGLLVDETMRTSIKNIFASGDVCTAGWTLAEHWFQVFEDIIFEINSKILIN